MYCKGGRGSIVVLITAPPAKLNLVKTSPYIYRARSRAAAKVMRSQRNCTNTGTPLEEAKNAVFGGSHTNFLFRPSVQHSP
jgi:hypothetical protein